MNIEKRYAETFWTTGDLEEALKGYYGEDFKITEEKLTGIMERIQDRLLDSVTEHGNDLLLTLAIRALENKDEKAKQDTLHRDRVRRVGERNELTEFVCGKANRQGGNLDEHEKHDKRDAPQLQ